MKKSVLLLSILVALAINSSGTAQASPPGGCDRHCDCDNHPAKPPGSYLCGWSCTCTGGVVVDQECSFCFM